MTHTSKLVHLLPTPSTYYRLVTYSDKFEDNDFKVPVGLTPLSQSKVKETPTVTKDVV